MYIANPRESVLLQASGEFRLSWGSRKVSFGVNSLVTFVGQTVSPVDTVSGQLCLHSRVRLLGSRKELKLVSYHETFERGKFPSFKTKAKPWPKKRPCPYNFSVKQRGAAGWSHFSFEHCWLPFYDQVVDNVNLRSICESIWKLLWK